MKAGKIFCKDDYTRYDLFCYLLIKYIYTFHKILRLLLDPLFLAGGSSLTEGDNFLVY